MNTCLCESGEGRVEGSERCMEEVVYKYIYSVIYLFSSCQRMLDDSRLYVKLKAEINDL